MRASTSPFVYLLPLGILLAVLWIAAGGESKPGSTLKRFATLVVLIVVAPALLAASLSLIADGVGLGKVGSIVGGVLGLCIPWGLAAVLLVRWAIAARINERRLT